MDDPPFERAWRHHLGAPRKHLKNKRKLHQKRKAGAQQQRVKPPTSKDGKQKKRPKKSIGKEGDKEPPHDPRTTTTTKPYRCQHGTGCISHS